MKKILICSLIIFIIIPFCSGCTKDVILKPYDLVNRTIGDLRITKSLKLKGTRTFASDHYVGNYEVKYNNFSGEETIFGGTTIERKNGSTIHVKITIENSKGDLKIIMKLKEKSKIIATEDGNYEYDFNVLDGSNYLTIKCDKYSGEVNIESIDKE